MSALSDPEPTPQVKKRPRDEDTAVLRRRLKELDAQLDAKVQRVEVEVDAAQRAVNGIKQDCEVGRTRIAVRTYTEADLDVPPIPIKPATAR
jgi:hypothetical protein